MSFQVGGVCYETELAAARATAASQLGSFVNHSGQSYLISNSNVSATQIEYFFTPVGGGTTISMLNDFSPQPCGLLSAEDGLQIGWLMISVWVAVYGIMFLTRAFNVDSDGDDYGRNP